VVIDDIREHAKKSPTKQPSQSADRPATKPENSSTGGTEDDGSTTQAKPKYTLMAKVPIPDTDDDDDGIILSDRLSGVWDKSDWKESDSKAQKLDACQMQLLAVVSLWTDNIYL